MNIQLAIVIICVAVAALFIGRRFLRALKSRSCPGCSKTSCCDPDACQERKQIEELRPRR
ncbi:MAG: FeoB-associated Cys-rich membrane protein [Desulfovibrio sp.]|uniref:FeoB-associated Cys-rich membrane protein n=1 Tax=Desulfovibrio sp. TaxID=885 RepID=UPI001A64F8C0|nr:FeoB-associated Cys-rich membrane protein [Desulfovibrio sp.]MBD5417795.1 FeoB-associated Cys-rich membrane protein [Desulfovibrio sp.]